MPLPASPKSNALPHRPHGGQYEGQHGGQYGAPRGAPNGSPNSSPSGTQNGSQKPGARRRLTVGFVLGKAFTLSAFSLFIDTLRLASDEFDRSGRIHADWEVISSTRHFIRSSCGVSIVPTMDLVSPERFDMLVVVGGLLGRDVACDDETIRYLQRAALARVPLIGVCTGSFILAEAGLLDSHEACVSWLHYDAFRDRYPQLKVRPDRLFNFDGRRGTCAGGASAADLAAVIVRTWVGRDAEQNALDILQIGRTRSAGDSQTRVPIRRPETTPDESEDLDHRVNAVLLLMEQRLADPLEIEELSATVGLSRRQLERLFQRALSMSPAAAYNTLRLRRANHLVVHTSRPLVDIAIDVGFGNASHMARSFRRMYGKSPSHVRATSTTRDAVSPA